MTLTAPLLAASLLTARVAGAAPAVDRPELGPTPARPGPVQQWSLEQLMRAVEGKHPRIQAERARRGIVDADVLTARWSIPNPVVMTDNGTAEYTYRLGLTQKIELGGKRRRRISLAMARYAVLESDLRVLAASLRADARRTYMDAFFAQERERMLIELIRSIDELLAIADARPGDIPKADVLEVRIIRLKARQALENSKFEHLQADIRLNNMLGNDAAVELVLASPARDKPPRWLDLKNDDWRTEFLAAYEALLAEALTHRPELERQLRERSVLHEEERLRRSERAPDLLLSVGPDFVPEPDYSRLHHGVFAMLSLDVPLFDRQQGPLADVRARRAQLSLAGDALRTDIAREVADAVAFACFQQSQFRLYERELVPAADAVYDDALRAFNANQTPFLVVVRAQESRVLTRLEYLRSLAAYHAGLAEVERALGTPAI